MTPKRQATKQTPNVRAKHLPPTPPTPPSSDRAERAEKAVDDAYRTATDDTTRPLFSDEMLALGHENEQSATEDEDPLCLFRYFHLLSHAEWYVISARKHGAKAVNMFTGESADGHIEFFGFACLGDPRDAECGTIPLDKARGMGLRDIPVLGYGVASVELDRFYIPERLSVVRERVMGKDA